ncbi:MAG: c-type cytochrome domain-containing protein, partial [Verrucomicrobiota bacterium]
MVTTLPATEEIAFFEAKVRPILVNHCYGCHSEEANKRKGGLWLDRKAGWVEGGDAGPSLVPGDPGKSLLIHSVRYTDPHLQMPPKSRLSKEEVGVLEEWVARGAIDPRDETLAGTVQEKIDFEAAREGWAFRPFGEVAIPNREGDEWSETPIDR